MRSRFFFALLSICAAASACKKSPAPPGEGSDPGAAEPLDPKPSKPTIVADALPRCRSEGPRVALTGEDLILGESAASASAIQLGLVRRLEGRVVASVARIGYDLSTSYVDLGPALGDDPPPVPFVTAQGAFAGFYGRRLGERAGTRDAGASASSAGRRELSVVRLDGDKAVPLAPALSQQADESLAFDVAWPQEGGGLPIVAWDEDAPPEPGRLLTERGLIKVQRLGTPAPIVVSPTTSDAESPRLLARRDGFYLAWLSKRSDAPDAALDPKGTSASTAEGPGEGRSFRWVEVVPLDDKGSVSGPVRRLTSERGHVLSFDLQAVADGDRTRLIALVQDEAAVAEGAGARIVRVVVDGDRVDAEPLLDGGVGTSLADLVPPAEAPAWLAYSDPTERMHLLPLGAGLTARAPQTPEPALDGARVLAAGTSGLVAVSTSKSPSVNDETSTPDRREARPELVRLTCP